MRFPACGYMASSSSCSAILRVMDIAPPTTWHTDWRLHVPIPDRGATIGVVIWSIDDVVEPAWLSDWIVLSDDWMKGSAAVRKEESWNSA